MPAYRSEPWPDVLVVDGSEWHLLMLKNLTAYTQAMQEVLHILQNVVSLCAVRPTQPSPSACGAHSCYCPGLTSQPQLCLRVPDWAPGCSLGGPK